MRHEKDFAENIFGLTLSVSQPPTTLAPVEKERTEDHPWSAPRHKGVSQMKRMDIVNHIHGACHEG